MKKLFAAILFAFLSVSAFAWDGTITIQKPTTIDISTATYQSFRVATPTVACTGGQAWVYLDSTDTNYNAIIANVLLAKSLGIAVTFYTTTVGGLCHVGYTSFAAAP